MLKTVKNSILSQSISWRDLIGSNAELFYKSKVATFYESQCKPIKITKVKQWNMSKNLSRSGINLSNSGIYQKSILFSIKSSV